MRWEHHSNVLLVEDEPDDETLILEALRRSGISRDVQVARDGAEALEYLFALGVFRDRDPRDLPQLVLLDLKLPKLSGLEVLERIRAHALTRDLPVVVFTSSQADEDQLRSGELGANGFVRKPVDFDSFLEAFRQLRRTGLGLLMHGLPKRPDRRRDRPT